MTSAVPMPPTAVRLRDAELVEEHLGALVRVRHLDPAHEADGRAVLVGDEQAVALGIEEPLREPLGRWIVEEIRRGDHRVDVTGAEARISIRSLAPSAAMPARRRLPMRTYASSGIARTSL